MIIIHNEMYYVFFFSEYMYYKKRIRRVTVKFNEPNLGNKCKRN